MQKIVVTNNQDFTAEQKARLERLGEVTYYDTVPKDAAEYLARVKGADVICSGAAGLRDAYAELKNVYVTVAFVNVAFVDLAVLKQHNVRISNAPGANRHAVSEWIIGMLIYMSRDFGNVLNRQQTLREGGSLPPITPGLAGKKITILGQGNIGMRVGEIAAVLDMQLRFFRRGDDLLQTVQDADIIVDTLSTNPTTEGLLSEKFFRSLKRGSYFATVTGPHIVDYAALLCALDNGTLAGAASDCGSILVGDTTDPLYQKLLGHPGMVVTPHISYNSEKARQTGCDIMIDNVEAYLSGRPIHLVEAP